MIPLQPFHQVSGSSLNAAAIAAAASPFPPPPSGHVTEAAQKVLADIAQDLCSLEHTLCQTRLRLFGSWPQDPNAVGPQSSPDGSLHNLMLSAEMLRQHVRRLNDAAMFLHEI